MSKKKCAMCAFMSGVLLLFVTICFADNPIIQTNYTADPAPMVHNDTMFLYTGHDEDNATGFLMNNWMLYTSTDMVNWTDHGIIATLNNFSWQAGSAWAAQTIERNGKFYMYCPLNYNANGRISIGVLVSNSPYGPFTDPLGRPLITGTSGANDYDPSVFVDSDGQAYIYWGGNGPCMWARLNADMISLSGGVQQASINTSGCPSTASYTEGPWFYKRNSNYYLAWASRCCPEGIGYAMSTSPTGPWTCRGLIMAPSDSSSGNHPGIIDYKGKSYVFGFNYSLLYSRIPYNPTKPERRSICVKEMTYNTDGTIQQVPWWGNRVPLPSVAQVGTLNPYDTTQAETICWSLGVRTQVCGEGGMNVDSIHNGDYIMVRGVNFGSGASSFIARVASYTSGGNIELRLDTTTGTLVGTCAVAGTSGWQTWATRTCAVTGATGTHNLYLIFTGGTGLLLNFNWWKFNPMVGIMPSKGSLGNIGNYIKVATGGGYIKLDFSQPVVQEKVSVGLFDLNGRLAAILFNGKVSSPHLALPINRTEIRPGTYLISISLNGTIALTKTVTLQ
jgi:arabinoxylan arabinofuranohydrolase